MTIVLPHGVLFRGGEEGEIRKNLIENNNIDAVIGLPANIFFGTGIPTIIMILKQKRQNTDVLIIDASKGFTKEGKNNKLRACDIRRIADTVRDRKSIDSYSRVVKRDEIRNNDYNLNIPRYVDSSEETESYDIYASMFGGVPENEIDAFSDYWSVFPSLKAELFEGEEEYKNIGTEDVKKTILQNTDVKNYLENFKKIFSDLGSSLDNRLIDDVENVSLPKTEEDIAQDLFKRFDGVALLDPYEAYQVFKDQFETISGDIELLQTEGLEAVNQVDPNMVIKKKNGKEAEVQDGWKGHILPFDLVQRVFLKEDLGKINEMQSELSDIPSSYDEALDNLSEEEKGTISDALNDENDGFVFKNIKGVIKNLSEDETEYKELIDVLKTAEELNKKEKQLKSELKIQEKKLHEKTKETIENLTSDEMHLMLHEKWVDPIVSGIMALAGSMIDSFTKYIEELASKYAVTMRDLDAEIKKTEEALYSMLSNLTGSDSDMEGIREMQALLGGGSHE